MGPHIGLNKMPEPLTAPKTQLGVHSVVVSSQHVLTFVVAESLQLRFPQQGLAANVTSKRRKNRAKAFEGVEMSDINRPQLTSS